MPQTITYLRLNLSVCVYNSKYKLIDVTPKFITHLLLDHYYYWLYGPIQHSVSHVFFTTRAYTYNLFQ